MSSALGKRAAAAAALSLLVSACSPTGKQGALAGGAMALTCGPFVPACAAVLVPAGAIAGEAINAAEEQQSEAEETFKKKRESSLAPQK